MSCYDQLRKLIEEELMKASPNSETERVLKEILRKEKFIYNTDNF